MYIPEWLFCLMVILSGWGLADIVNFINEIRTGERKFRGWKN